MERRIIYRKGVMRLEHILIYPIGTTDACAFAGSFLEKAGYSLTDHPTPEVTHLLLDVPSFAVDGSLRGGGSLLPILERLPPGITLIGGNLKHPAITGYPVLDLLRDENYLAQNAAITAQCALRVADPLLSRVLTETPVLVIGWGRIGKCLTKLLTGMGCSVTVAARNPKDRAIISALGWKSVDIPDIPGILSDIGLIFNTAPAPVLGADILNKNRNCLKIDLASSPGLSGSDVVYARGLPGQYAPESSGRLIAETILRHLREETL